MPASERNVVEQLFGDHRERFVQVARRHLPSPRSPVRMISCGSPFGAECGTICSLLFLSETGVRQCELLLHLLISTISCHQISQR
jgi:hypothetical protein